MYSKEFGAYSPEYYEDAIRTGRITVNNKPVSIDYHLKNGDVICHTVHRHEPPVPYEPAHIISETDDIIAVNKPSSIPIHTCGAYRYNSLEMILKTEGHLPDFHLIHRLDRVTSGVVLLAKTKQAASQYSELLRRGGVHKLYLAIVEGECKWKEEWREQGLHVESIEEGGIGVGVGIAIVSQRDGVMKCDDQEGKVSLMSLMIIT